MKNKLLKSLKILLVEDDKNIARLLKNAIGDSFYSFSLAEDGVDGLEKFELLKPDIVITDINMPRLTGLEMAKKLRKNNSKIPIIILSAFSEKEKLFDAIDARVTKYLVKPFDPDELLEYIISISDEIGDKIIKLYDDFSFNKNTNALYRGSRYVALSKNEVRFFLLLLENNFETVKDANIKSNLWDEEVTDDRLRTFIRRLRAKTSKILIENFKGVGYRLKTNEN